MSRGAMVNKPRALEAWPGEEDIPRTVEDCGVKGSSLQQVMAQWWQILLGLWTVMLTLAGDKPINICMNDNHHKQEPGPEDKLFLECVPWKDNACCTLATSWEAHLEESSLFNFSMMHCGLLTPVCHKHFIQAICFHECSPNLGPWIQPVVPGRQKERVWGVPLCWEDCEEWWKDCHSSYTCKSNWHSGWDWSQGQKACREPHMTRPLTFPAVIDCTLKLKWTSAVYNKVRDHQKSVRT
ncbi:hypothetical protein STEG23_000732 [Scotinomys teguina]